MVRSCGHGAGSTRSQTINATYCNQLRSFSASSGVALRRQSSHATSAAWNSDVLTSSSVPSNISVGIHHIPDVSCRDVAVAERPADAMPSTSDPVGTARIGSGHSISPKLDIIDVAVIGADVPGLAAALATSRAHPGARVLLYDTAFKPPTACDGGVLLSVNGLRALKALDANLYNRIATELSSPIHEALWFDLEGELVRRTPLCQPITVSAAALTSRGSGTSSGSRRRVAARRLLPRPSVSRNPLATDPDPSGPPLVTSLHDLREALSEALPEEVQICGRHHLLQVEPCSSSSSGGGGGTGGGTGVVLRFAASPNGAPKRTVRTRVLVGADGPKSAVKRLQFDTPPELHHQQSSGHIVWRGRFTLRPRDPDFARLRNFTTACRTWVDLRAAPGADRTATLTPAGPNTYVWSASCPATLLASRGLRKSAEAEAPYWRCLAMFEDFPQDFYAALRATSANAVVEYDTCRPPTASAAAGLAAPWQWFSGPAALVGDAVYSLPVEDASSTAVNLALEDAAVLGACTAQYGLTARALQEYARQRGPRVSAMLAAPPSALERVRLREALFLPQSPTPTLSLEAAAAPRAATDNSSLPMTVAAAVDSAAAATVAMTSPTQPLEEILANVAAAAAAAAAAATATTGPPDGFPQASAIPGRPSGGASRDVRLGPAPMALPQPTLSGPSSPVFSRPSGARRMGPMPAAIAAVMAILAAGSRETSSRAAAATASATAATCATAAAANNIASSAEVAVSASASATAAVQLGAAVQDELKATAVATSSADTTAEPSSVVATIELPSYEAGLTPSNVWKSLLATQGSVLAGGSGSAPALERKVRDYCSVGTPLAVWQALLGAAPGKAHDLLSSLPYNAAETPALVWMSLLGSKAASFSSSSSPDDDSDAATATAVSGAAGAAIANVPAATGGSSDNACTLLPRPVLKQRSAAGPVAAAASTDEPSSAVLSGGFTADGADASSSLPSSPQRLVAVAAAPGGATASSLGLEPPRRRRPRSQAGPVSGRWAGGDRRSSDGGKVAGGYGKPRRSAAASAAANAAASPSVAAPQSRPKAKGAAAAAAAKMTVSLSAAAALGGVIGAAGTGHIPMVDVAAALHTHGAVAQFWEELNSLTLSSASLSSIDLP